MKNKKDKTAINEKTTSPKKSSDGLIKRMRLSWKAYSKLKKMTIVIATFFVFYTITGFLIIPAVVKSVAQKELTKRLGRQVTIEKIHLNPYTFVAKIQKFKIANLGEKAPLFELDEVKVNLQGQSLFRLALVVKEVKITSPVVRVERTGALEFDFDDIIQKVIKDLETNATPEPEVVEDGEPFKFEFSINNISLENAQLYLHDRFEQKKHAITKVRIAIPFISNFDHHVENYITPYLGGVLNGSEFKFEGQVKPFHETRESSINFAIKDMDIAHFATYVPEFVKARLKSCLFSSDMTVTFALPDADMPKLLLNGDFSVSNINLEHDEETLFSLEKFAVVIGDSYPLERKLLISSVDVIAPFVNVKRFNDGTLNFHKLVDLESLPKSEVQAEEVKKVEVVDMEPKPLNIGETIDMSVDSFLLQGGSIKLTDLTNDVPFNTLVSEMSLKINGLSTTASEPAKLGFTLKASNGERLSVNANVSVPDLSVKSTTELTGINLPAYAPFYQKFLNSKLNSGSVDFKTDFSVKLTEQGLETLAANNIEVEVNDFVLQSPDGNDIVSTPLVEVKVEEADLVNRNLVVGLIKLTDGGLNVLRAEDGHLNLERIVNLDALPKGEESEKDEEVAEESEVPAEPFRVLLKKFQIENYGVSVKDNALITNCETTLFPINFVVENVDTTPNSELKYDFKTTVNELGQVAAGGSINITKKSLNIKSSLTDFSLPEFQPYIGEFLNLFVESGLVSADATVEADLSDLNKPVVTAEVNNSIKKLSILYATDGEKCIGWDLLEISGFKAGTEPLSVEIDKVLVDGQSATVVVDEDGDVNLTKILKQSEVAEEGVKPKEDPQEKVDVKEFKLPTITVTKVETKNCSLKLVDRSLSPNFETEVKDITLNVGKITTKESENADVGMSLNIDRHSKMTLTGKVNPLQKSPYADLGINISDIDLSSLTPYSGKYVGYEIAKGKLHLDLNYKVDAGKISATNDVKLDQLTFGEDVDSDDATSLPVKFALSIITDKNGQVKLSLPISGDLNDPDFSIGGAVVTVLTNIFTNIITSPFSFIASMYGDSEALKMVEFPTGAFELTEMELEKLKTIATMMQDRPGIKIDVKGYSDPVSDRKTILDKRFEQFLKQALYNDLWKSEQKQTTVDAMVINWDNQEEFLDTLEEAYENAPFDKEENFLGIVVSQPKDVMEKMIKNHLKVSDDDLRKLAIKRAESISHYLTEFGKIDASRIFFIEPDSEEVDNKMSVYIDVK